MTSPKVLLFDLGGVIVRWIGIDALSDLTGWPRERVLTTFAASKTHLAYEIGQCSDDEFAAEMIKRFELLMDVSEFQKAWQSWVTETYPGTLEMLAKLREDYTIACLSNTNALHWTRLQKIMQVEDCFDYAFASQLIGAAKPNPESYLMPLKAMNVPPEDVWFFDDTEINLEAARKLGLTAFHINRDVGVRPTLIELGLVSP